MSITRPNTLLHTVINRYAFSRVRRLKAKARVPEPERVEISGLKLWRSSQRVQRSDSRSVQVSGVEGIIGFNVFQARA